MSVRMISSEMVKQIQANSRCVPRARQHLNLHASHAEPVQRLLNAIQVDSYIRPHRHSIDPKVESLFAVSGKFALFVFDDCGGIIQVELLASELFKDNTGSCFGAEIASGTWHTIVALQPNSVLLEIKAGPFDPDAAKEFATWSPDELSDEASDYLFMLKSRALNPLR